MGNLSKELSEDTMKKVLRRSILAAGLAAVSTVAADYTSTNSLNENVADYQQDPLLVPEAQAQYYDPYSVYDQQVDRQTFGVVGNPMSLLLPMAGGLVGGAQVQNAASADRSSLETDIKAVEDRVTIEKTALTCMCSDYKAANLAVSTDLAAVTTTNILSVANTATNEAAFRTEWIGSYNAFRAEYNALISSANSISAFCV